MPFNEMVIKPIREGERKKIAKNFKRKWTARQLTKPKKKESWKKMEKKKSRRNMRKIIYNGNGVIQIMK